MSPHQLLTTFTTQDSLGYERTESQKRFHLEMIRCESLRFHTGSFPRVEA